MKRRKKSPDCYVGGIEERDLWEVYFKIVRGFRGTRRAFIRGVSEASRGIKNNPFGALRPFKRRAYAAGATFHEIFYGQFINGKIKNYTWFVEYHIKQLRV